MAGKSVRVRRRSFNHWLIVGLGLGVFIAVYGSVIYFTYISSPDEDGGGPIHIHTSFRIVVEDREVPIPAGIGIAPELWRDRSLNRFGLSAVEAPLHTHDDTGVIHIEANVNRTFTLGDFLRIWGVEFNATCIMDICADNHYRLTVLVDGEETNIPFDRVALRDGGSIILLFTRSQQ